MQGLGCAEGRLAVLLRKVWAKGRFQPHGVSANLARMTQPQFIHLRIHTEHSLLEGAVPVKKLIKLCAKHEMPAVAVTDTNNMFAALEFSVYAKERACSRSSAVRSRWPMTRPPRAKSPAPLRPWFCWRRTRRAI